MVVFITILSLIEMVIMGFLCKKMRESNNISTASLNPKPEKKARAFSANEENEKSTLKKESNISKTS